MISIHITTPNPFYLLCYLHNSCLIKSHLRHPRYPSPEIRLLLSPPPRTNLSPPIRQGPLLRPRRPSTALIMETHQPKQQQRSSPSHYPRRLVRRFPPHLPLRHLGKTRSPQQNPPPAPSRASSGHQREAQGVRPGDRHVWRLSAH